MTTYEPGSLQHLNALYLKYDSPVPEEEMRAWRLASVARQVRMEEEAKNGPGSLSHKLSLGKRLGIAQRMNRE